MNSLNESYPRFYLYKRIVQAKLFIDSNFQEHINLDHIADEAYFSKFHFIRLFKQTYGKTPHQYLTFVRVEKARLLLQKAMPVAEVCVAVGFDSITSFTGLFKKVTSLTPAVYQKQQLTRRKEIDEVPLKYIPNCFAEQNGWT